VKGILRLTYSLVVTADVGICVAEPRVGQHKQTANSLWAWLCKHPSCLAPPPRLYAVPSRMHLTSRSLNG
jgi:hypothetical protein